MKKSKILSVVFASLMFLFPMIVKADGEVVSINDQDLYATLEAALAAAESGDTISLIQNLEIAADTTIPAGITLKNTTNTLTIASEKTLTISGKLETSSNSNVVIDGTLAIVSGGIVDNNSTFTLKGTIRLEGNAVMNIGGVLDLQANSKVVSTVAGPIVNINKTGSIIGSASSLSTAHNTVFNNYAGRMGASLTATLGSGMYKYYPIYDATNDKWYQTFDEIEAGVSATVLAPHIVNGDTTIAEGVQITGAAGVATTVNGTFTINGSYGMENGYTSIVAHNLYGSGTVTLKVNGKHTSEYGTWLGTGGSATTANCKSYARWICLTDDTSSPTGSTNIPFTACDSSLKLVKSRSTSWSNGSAFCDKQSLSVSAEGSYYIFLFFGMLYVKVRVICGFLVFLKILCIMFLLLGFHVIF